MRLFLALITCIFGGISASRAAPTILSYQGRIIGTNGEPLEYSHVSFLFQITSPNGLCVLYEEQLSNIDMQNSGGVFDTPIGQGARTFPLGPGANVLTVFNNQAPSLSCKNGSTYVPTATDLRKLHVQFHDGIGWRIVTPDTDIRSVPYAGSAAETAKLAGNSASNFVLRNPFPTCGMNTFLSWDGTDFTCEGPSGSVGGTVMDVSSTNTFLSVTNGALNPSLALNVGTTTNTLAAGNDTRFTNPRPPTGPAGGALSSTYPNPSLGNNAVSAANITDGSVSFAKLANGTATGQVLRYSGSAWQMVKLNYTDLVNANNVSPWPGTCDAGEFITWLSAADGFACTTVGTSAITAALGYTPTNAARTITAGTGLSGGGDLSVNRTLTVDVGTGAQQIPQLDVGGKLNSSVIPSTIVGAAWTADGSGNINRPTGNVGLGIATATEKLEVVGKVKATEYCLGASCLSAWPSAPSMGTVTNVATGTGLTGGPISTTGTISIANDGVGTTQLADGAVTPVKLETVSGLTAGSSGNASNIPSITVNNKGRVTSINTNTLPAPPAASGSSGKFLKSNGTNWSGQDVLFSDVKNAGGTSAFNLVSCADNQTVAWASLTNSFTCQNIGSLDGSAISAGTLNISFLPTSVTDGLWAVSSGNVSRSTGNVGIGVAAPATQLEVSAADTATEMRIVNRSSSATRGPKISIRNYSGGNGGQPVMSLFNSRGSESPTAAIQSGDILGSVEYVGVYDAVGGSARAVEVRGEADGAFSGTSAPGRLVFRTTANASVNPTERMRISANGNVGIGTTNPTATLDVAGPIRPQAATLGAACTVMGAQAYNATTGAPMYCNGSAWIRVGSQGGKLGMRSCNTGYANDVMVAVGNWCVDKYEASVWSSADGTGTGFFTDSTTSADTDNFYPTGAANVPASCNRNGTGCTQYAVSKPSVTPSRGVTWNQASRFCANSGKQLIPDGVWQIAVQGTYDPGAGTGTGGTGGGSAADSASAQCNINTQTTTWSTWLKSNSGVRPTARAGATNGGTNTCRSNFGVEDMVGNLWEWTDMNGMDAGVDLGGFSQGKNNSGGGPYTTADGTWNYASSAYGCDGPGASKGTCGWKNNTPLAPMRGGTWKHTTNSGVSAITMANAGTSSSWITGFRCARPR